MTTATETIADFTSRLAPDELPPEVMSAARLHLLDTLGCGLAAYAMKDVDFVVEAAQEAAPGEATAIGDERGLFPGEAALVNGALFHALDFDDTHPGSVVHVSAAVVAAGLAAAELHRAEAADLMAALVVGNETSVRVGLASRGAFHARGLHPTGVAGVFGATATASYLRRLSSYQTVQALGIAGSMASGLLEFLADGSKTKPIHPGWAANAGLTAARLAAYGGTGPATVLEGKRGLLSAYLHGREWDIASEVRSLGSEWVTPEISFKPYPACHYTHAPLDALQALIDDEKLTAADVYRGTILSDVTGAALVLDPIEDKLNPRTPYDAKFSAPFCMASLLLRGRLGVDSFTEEAVRDATVLDLMSRFEGEIKAYAAAPDAFPGGVVIETVDGRTLFGELRYQRGGKENPMTTDSVLSKFRENASLALDEAAVTQIETEVLGPEGDLRWIHGLCNAEVNSKMSTAV